MITSYKGEPKFVLETFIKRRGGLRLSLERSLALDERGAIRLLDALQTSLLVREPGTVGRYYVVKTLIDGVEATETDPRRIVDGLLTFLADKKIAKHLSERDIGAALRESLTNAMKISELRSALALLRNYLNTGVSDEKTYQTWCEQHTWAFGNAFVMKDSVRKIAIGDALDLLLPTVLTGYREIIELKRPDMDILHYDANHKNYYFSQDASRAIGQCHRYIDSLHEAASAGLRDHPEIVACHPKAIIVIGRSNEWLPEQIRALHVLNRGMHHITVMTYDQLLVQGERALQIVDSKKDGFSPLDLDGDDVETAVSAVEVAEHMRP